MNDKKQLKGLTLLSQERHGRGQKNQKVMQKQINVTSFSMSRASRISNNGFKFQQGLNKVLGNFNYTPDAITWDIVFITKYKALNGHLSGMS